MIWYLQSSQPGEDTPPMPSDINPCLLTPINLPLPIMVLAFSCIVPLILNIIYIICFFKFPKVRKAPADIIFVLALLYTIKDFSEIALGVLTLIPDLSITTDWTSHSNLIYLNLVYCYNIALIWYLIQVTRGSGLYQGQSTMIYHSGAWIFSIGTYLIPVFGGNKVADLFGSCFWSLQAWDFIYPGAFTLALLCAIYSIVRLNQEAMQEQLRSMHFLTSFKAYMALSCLYIAQQVIQFVFDLHIDVNTSFDALSLGHKFIISIGYALGIAFTYSVFVIRYIDPYIQRKIKILLRLIPNNSQNDTLVPFRETEDMKISMLSSDVGIVIRRESGGPVEALTQENLKYKYMHSIIVSMSYLLTKLEMVVQKMDLTQFQQLNKKIEKTEKLKFELANLTQYCPEISETIEKLEIQIYEGYIHVSNTNMLISMLWENRQLLNDLKRSFDLGNSLDTLKQGHTHTGIFYFYTYDNKFLIKLVREDARALELRKFALNLFHYQHDENNLSCIEKVIGTFQFVAQALSLNYHFVIIKNSIEEIGGSLEATYEIKGDNTDPQQTKNIQNIKEAMKKPINLVPSIYDSILKDIDFLRKCRLSGYSLILNIYNPNRSEWDLQETEVDEVCKPSKLEENNLGLATVPKKEETVARPGHSKTKLNGKFIIKGLSQLSDSTKASAYFLKIKDILTALQKDE